ncbi:hypothetical protein D3C73_1377700 [compost metagenome]
MQQTHLQFFQLCPQLVQVRPWQVGRLVRCLPLRNQSILHQFVGFDLRGGQFGGFIRFDVVCDGLLPRKSDEQGFPGGILDRFAGVPFGQRHQVGNIQALVDGVQQWLQRFGRRGGQGGVGDAGE